MTYVFKSVEDYLNEEDLSLFEGNPEEYALYEAGIIKETSAFGLLRKKDKMFCLFKEGSESARLCFDNYNEKIRIVKYHTNFPIEDIKVFYEGHQIVKCEVKFAGGQVHDKINDFKKFFQD